MRDGEVDRLAAVGESFMCILSCNSRRKKDRWVGMISFDRWETELGFKQALH